MGHSFNNEEVTCACGRTFFAHRAHPRPCPLTFPPVPRKVDGLGRRIAPLKQPFDGATVLDNLRLALGYSNRFIGAQCGISPETARRAIVGIIGGRGGTSPATTERVGQYIRDMAKTRKP